MRLQQSTFDSVEIGSGMGMDEGMETDSGAVCDTASQSDPPGHQEATVIGATHPSPWEVSVSPLTEDLTLGDIEDSSLGENNVTTAA